MPQTASAPTQRGPGVSLAERIKAGDLAAAPALLNLLESAASRDRDQAQALLEALSPCRLGGEAQGQIIGLTGPPGAGKSTLLGALIGRLRAEGERSIAVLAVDPSSKRSGGSLLGDRVRIALPTPDPRVFIRSSAAGDRHGGLSRATRQAAEALAVAFDLVVIETVGVGQSETEVAEVADTVVLVVQPGSGDTLQFLKAGIMEIPDIIVVTKADLGELAQRSARELEASLRTLGTGQGAGATPPSVIALSALEPPSGLEQLLEAIDAQARALRAGGGRALAERRERARRAGALSDFEREHGERGVRTLGGRRRAEAILASQPAGASSAELAHALELALAASQAEQ
ncbi:MAG TPA: ATP-binding cassette domain-containing protein [Solirubrobacteraceae bacterium]|nr:ATP-binding cassette domain-containing protein [Solirubrobacteraceae bacterium]